MFIFIRSWVNAERIPIPRFWNESDGAGFSKSINLLFGIRSTISWTDYQRTDPQFLISADR
jgi:hypothetical protein